MLKQFDFTLNGEYFIKEGCSVDTETVFTATQQSDGNYLVDWEENEDYPIPYDKEEVTECISEDDAWIIIK